MASMMGSSGGNTNVVVNIMANIQNLTVGLQQARNQLNQAKTGVTDLSRGLFNLQNVWLGWLSVNFGKTVIENTIGDLAQFERYEMAFKTLFQSAGAAKVKMSELWDFAARTPFQMDEVVKASLIMESFGLNSKTYLKDIADLTSAFPSAKIDVVARAISRIKSGDFGEALERLRDFGISSQMLREKGIKFDNNNHFLGSANQLLDAVMKVIRERFGGMTDELSKTMYGRWTTLIDLLKQTGRQFGAGMFDPVKQGLEIVISYIEKLSKDGTLDQWAARIMFWMLEIKDAAIKVGNFLYWVYTVVVQYWPQIEPILKAVAIMMIVNKIVHSDFYAIVMHGVGVLKGLFLALKALIVAQDAAAAVKALRIALQELEASTGVGVIILIIGALVMLLMESTRVRRALQSFFTWAEGRLDAFANYIEKRLGFLGKIFAGFARVLAAISGGAAQFVEPVEDRAKREAETMQTYLDSVAAKNAELAALQADPALQKILNQADKVPDVNSSKSGAGQRDAVDILTKPFDWRRKSAEFEMENNQVLNKLANQGEGTFRYWEDTKSGLLAVRQILLDEITALNGLIPGLTGELKEKALDKLWEATKKSNDILLQIKENTDPKGDFNMPSGLIPTTLFGIRADQTGARTLTIANARFVFSFDKPPQTVEEVKKMMQTVEAGLYQNLLDRAVRE